MEQNSKAAPVSLNETASVIPQPLTMTVSLKGSGSGRDFDKLRRDCQALIQIMRDDCQLKNLIQNISDQVDIIMSDYELEDNPDDIAVIGTAGKLASAIFSSYVKYCNASVSRSATPSRYMILPNSLIKKVPRESCNKSTKELHRKCREEGYFDEIPGDDEHYKVVKMLEVSSLSAAASLISGNTVNGRSTVLAQIAWDADRKE